MRGEQISVKRAQAALSSRLRTEGKTWTEIAAVFRDRYRLNGRVAMRLAHQLSQKDVADEWNARWPDTPRSHKNISYWEQWPSASGHQPSLDALRKLAELYECGVADLLADYADYKHLDAARNGSGTPNRRDANELAGKPVSASPRFPMSGILALNPASGLHSSKLTATRETESLAWKLQEADFNELEKVLVMWAEKFNPNPDRRALLFKLSAAFAIAAAAPTFDRFDADERDRASAVLEDPRRLDEPTISQAEAIVQECRIQGDILGPQVALYSVMSERRVIQTVLRGNPPDHFMPRMLSIYAELTQLAGWLLFNLGDYRAARHYYDEARTTAHDAHNVELVTFILCTMSHLATWEGKPGVGIDHAVAAQAWAAKSGSTRARAYSADVAARAYAADRQWSECRECLDDERTALSEISTGKPAHNWWYFHDESFYWATESECALARQDSWKAIEALTNSLRMIDPANTHNYAATISFQSEAHIQQGNIADACKILGDVARLTVTHTSRRLDQRIIVLRGMLDRWNSRPEVSQLDETLNVYRGNAFRRDNTNRS